jgi:ribosomal protein L10
MAAGHNADRKIVAALGALVRGRNAASIQSRKPVRVKSASVTSAPYTGALRHLKAP